MDSLIRKIMFWILDFFKGRKVRKHYNEIKKIINCNYDNQAQLDYILNYTINNSSYYKKIKSNNLKDFPVNKKVDLNNHYNEIIIGDIKEKGLHWTCTSGSTGNPLKIPQDKNKRNRTKADLLFFNDKCGWHLGDKYVFIRSWVKLYNMSKLRIFAQNFIRIDTNTFDDDSKEKLRKLLKSDKKIKCIISYSSAIIDFVNYLKKKNDNSSMYNINVIVTASDELTSQAKKDIKEMFGCKVINRISNEEHGLLAMMFDDDDYFTLNTASYYFEILKLNSDEAAEIGELGRLVVTDLYNKKFPLIRYDIGDLAIGLEKNSNGSYNKLRSFEGRGTDAVLNSQGVPLTCVSISTHICTISGIEKYQLNVYKNKIVVKIVISGNDKDTIIKQLKDNMKELFGTRIKIEIEIVENIDVEKNGKYKVIKKID